MKRNILSLLIALFATMQVAAQTYDNLWKQAEINAQKDQPKSEIAVMKKIIAKASAAKDYGQLLAAEIRQMTLWKEISADSLTPNVKRMEAEVLKVNDPALKAVRYAVLGKVYRDMNEKKSQEFFKKALGQPELLARHTSAEYVPLTLKGVDGSSFNNDLLHLIGFEADSKEAYLQLYTYYNKVGNRGAACLCAYKLIEKYRQDDVREVKKSKYLQTIDSLIQIYQDIPEAGELAVEHFRFMEGATDAKPQDKLNYINYALSRWGEWSRMNELRNAQKRLTEPMFRVKDMPQVLRPGEKVWVQLDVRNLQNLKISISRLNITADNEYDAQDEATYKMLLKKTTKLHQKDFSRNYYGRPDYETVKDSIEIGGNLPLGAYLMEVTSDNTSIAPQRELFYVSNLAVMIQQLPDDKHRYVVVNATDGQPIAGAKIELYDQRYDFKTKKDKRIVHARLTTDENGEAYFKNVDGNVLISTSNDKFTPAKDIYLSRTRYYEKKDNETKYQVYTDRAIYRPGQKVHASAISYTVKKGLDASVPGKSMELKFVLSDANWKQVAEQKATTDEYGTASVDFELPKEGKTGQYSISVNGTASEYFRVEEYKRPTFEITFPKVNEKYNWGDTVVVKATAKTYAGVPVQGAKVEYQVTRRNQLWWWGAGSAGQLVKTDSCVTREDGTFDVEIPLEASLSGKDEVDMSDFMRIARFFNFEVSAIVTDISGESHEGVMSLPLGTKPTILTVNLPKRIETDSLKTVTFAYRNASGMPISSRLKYRIDKGEWKDAEANVPVSIKEYASSASSASSSLVWKSGVHQLEAICGQDTLQQKFTLFSMKDTHPVEPTTEWYYQTAKTFPRDGKPVYIQVGSSENGAHIVYSIIAGNKLLEKGAWELGDSIVTLPFTYKEEYASGIVLNYSFVKQGKCYTRMMSIARPLPEKKLNIAWKTFRNRLTPGQKEEWTLKITTPDGKPAKAQLMSVLYDKSLDQIAPHSWKMSLGFSQWLPSCYWTSNLWYYKMDLLGVYPTKYFDQKQLDVDKFDGKFFSYNGYMQAEELSKLERSSGGTVEAVRIEKHSSVKDEVVREEAKGIWIRSSKMTRVGAAAPSANKVFDVVEEMPQFAGGSGSDARQFLDKVQVRENMNETAFFYPALESDNNGNVAIRFTLPESVTTWKFMGLAHDKEMRNGLLVDEAVAQKTVMVQPNMPRFLREGDKSTIVVKLFNTSDKKVSGNARMQILDPETNKVVWQKTQNYCIDAEGSATISFDVQGLKEGVYINKVVAAGNGYSDGEQHYLPVLSNRELVVNTLPITLHQKGEQSFDLSKLFLNKEGKQAKGAEEAKVTIEYTNNPSWLMVKALPAISNPDEEDAISLMSAIYANTITNHVQKHLSLENLTQESIRLQNQVEKLKKLQNPDGSFSWWKGMKGSRYMTTSVAEMMVRLNAIAGVQKSTARMLTSAIDYLSWQTAQEVREMKKQEEKKQKVNPSEQALHYLYILSMDGRKMKQNLEADKAYLLEKMSKMTGDFSIYGKARAAVVLARNSQQNAAYREKAGEYLQSVNEYAVYREEMGRYYDTRKALYSWRNYKIPTQVSVIEAMQMLKPNDKQTIEELQRWLLMSKRTQVWDTPVNTVDAVYAFMKGNENNWNRKAENAVLKLDGKLLPMPQDSTTLGYVKTERPGKASKLSIDKKSDYTSWGAVYAEFKQPISEIGSMESGIKVRRVIVPAESESKGNAQVGEKVKVTLIITADRDYDFVQITDKRAACLEPVNQLSGYQWSIGCYVSPRDHATNFYFDRLSKGKHIVEMEYYVDRKGDYQSGTCIAECTYSPEFSGRTETYELKVNN
ncbi:alpha-2-macroglobulin family protein [Segatella copri]|uniref:alpha-2-macroglobulin family protein n=1 Tax=Segatella copri TaxID=165179 RepID=UPI0012927012|nr:alpha-2-macroglobulin family protein [Segatella copri]MQM46886.1 alpha-2-macroglobulin [Segatella copri]MQM48827.1 alpha-2-macroglobulin [Segatella copri]MQM68609.1 alpha-2-macroglobulin [Segatella copri]MQM74680.1 alpha-2-macroglobulin [Segatella copri]MQM83999.1 alpha-2-macroglobulin [Segatella copri]